MARTLLTKQQIVQAGLTGTLAAANVDGNLFEGSGLVYLEVANGSGSSINVTVQTAVQVAGLDVGELVVAIPATTGRKKIGPFNKRAFNRPSGVADAGFVYVDFSAVTTVTVGLFGF